MSMVQVLAESSEILSSQLFPQQNVNGAGAGRVLRDTLFPVKPNLWDCFYSGFSFLMIEEEK